MDALLILVRGLILHMSVVAAQNIVVTYAEAESVSCGWWPFRWCGVLIEDFDGNWIPKNNFNCCNTKFIFEDGKAFHFSPIYRNPQSINGTLNL